MNFTIGLERYWMRSKELLVNNKNFQRGTLFSLFSFLNSGISFLITIVMAKCILPDSYGQLNLYSTMVELLGIFVCLDTIGIIGVNYYRKSRRDIKGYVNVVFITTLVFGSALLFLIIGFKELLQQIVGINAQFQIYAVLVCVLQVVTRLVLDIWRLEEKVWSYGKFTLANVIANLFLTIIFVGLLRWDWEGRVYASIFSCVLFFLIAFYILAKKGFVSNIKPSKAQFYESYKFGLPLVPHSISFWFRSGLDRYVIHNYVNNAAVGLFGFAFNFASIIQIIGVSFNLSNTVNIYKILSGKTPGGLERLRKECRLFVLFYIGLTTVVSMGTMLFIPILFPKYTDCIYYVVPLSLGALGQCLYLVYVNVLFYYKKTKVIMYVTFSMSLLHCLLSFGLTRYGVFYTACVSMVSNFLIFLGVFMYTNKVLKEEFSAESV